MRVKGGPLGVSLENSLLVGFKGLDREGFGWGIKGLAVTVYSLGLIVHMGKFYSF